jgi:quercetin dioxygenase-like cupin family protein
MQPYIDEKISDNEWIRTFDPNISESEEYVWHRDYADRIFTVIEGEGWKFQFDNELPFFINKSDKIHVPKMAYHRLIPNKNKLRIEINEKF